MKTRLLIYIVGIALVFSAVPARAEAVQEGIAAVVNDSIVTVTDVRARISLYNAGNKDISPQDYKKMEHQVLDRLIDEALQLQEAKKLGVTVDEAQVSNGFAFVAKQNNVSPDEFKKRLKDTGVNIDSLFAQIKAEIAWDIVTRRQLRPQINVSESDIDMTIDQLTQGAKKQYHVAEIVLNVATPAQETDTRVKAEELAQKIRDGKPFSEAARETSQGPTAAAGGDIGWVDEGQLGAERDAALGKLQPGQVSDPLHIGDSYHILFLREVRRNAAAPVAAAPAPADDKGPLVLVKQILIPVKPSDTPAVIKTKMVRGAALKKEITSCEAMDKRMKDFPAQGTGTLGTGYENSLQEPLRSIIKKLAVNELSEPIKAPGGWAMLMVCSRETPKAPAAETANLNLDKADEKSRETVASKLGLQRLDKMADHYLRDLRAAAFIDKRI